MVYRIRDIDIGERYLDVNICSVLNAQLCASVFSGYTAARIRLYRITFKLIASKLIRGPFYVEVAGFIPHRGRVHWYSFCDVSSSGPVDPVLIIATNALGNR